MQTDRCDAELPAPAALLVKEAWKQKLLAARSYDPPIDLPVDGAVVEFALLSRTDQHYAESCQ